MTRVAVVTVLAGLVVASISAQTQAPPSADQILEKHIDAVGGRAALERVSTMTARGTLSVPDAGLTGSIELYGKAPDKVASFVDFGGMQQAEAYDGTTAWSDDPQNGVLVKAGAELVDARNGAVFNKELQMKAIYPTMTVSGPEAVGQRQAWVVTATPAAGTPVKLFYDAETGLLIRQMLTRQTPMGPLEVDLRLEDYRTVDGVRRPHTIRQLTSMFSAVIQLSEIRHNVEIDDAVFKKPGL
ncbi:MAG TPA: hypothetical protein VLA20_00660 [Vicinamibacterales bacterium]|nr:hypothetical protein [Vicinamibacterales bacterium]